MTIMVTISVQQLLTRRQLWHQTNEFFSEKKRW